MNALARLRAHVRALSGERHPLTSPSSLLRAEAYLIDQFSGQGLEVQTHPFDALGARWRNVIGILPAARATVPSPTSPPPPLIIAAHYDTVPGSPGADDNASALAAMLETAHRLREVPLGREIHFIAFSLEEEDLLGSLAYTAMLKARDEVIVGAIVLECVGYTDPREGSQAAPPHVPIALPSVGDFLGIVGNTTSAGLVEALEQAAAAHVPVLKTVSLVVPGNGEALPDTRRSDHAAFWLHGYPAVMLTDTANFRNPHYHQATDTPETLDLTFLAHVVDLLVATASRLAASQP